jgi:hypothetical protein
MNYWRIGFTTTLMLIILAIVGCVAPPRKAVQPVTSPTSPGPAVPQTGDKPAPTSPTVSWSDNQPSPPNQTIDQKLVPKLVDTVPTSFQLNVKPLYLGGGL